MNATLARNIGLLLALALVVFLVYKHVQTAPVATGGVGGTFSDGDDVMFGNGIRQSLDIVAGNPNY